jgi:hypothetical protein
MDVPITFEGYNDGKGVLFPFWSSPSITLIMMMTALSKYSKAIETWILNEIDWAYFIKYNFTKMI